MSSGVNGSSSVGCAALVSDDVDGIAECMSRLITACAETILIESLTSCNWSATGSSAFNTLVVEDILDRDGSVLKDCGNGDCNCRGSYLLKDF